MTVVDLVLPALLLVAWLADRKMLLDAHAREMERQASERSRLLNRIKPETAQFEVPAVDAPAMVTGVALDNDDEYSAAKVTRDEYAAMLFPAPEDR